MAAAEKKEEGEAAAEEGAKPKKSKKKLLIIIVAAVLVLGGGGVAFVLGGGDAEPLEEVELPPNLVLADIGQYIVNLASSTNFLKVSMLAEYDANIVDRFVKMSSGKGGGHGGGGAGAPPPKGPAGWPPGIEPREPMIKDAIIRVLSAKTADEVLTSAGKETLKDELIEAINEAIEMDDNPVVGIYFTEFIVQ